MKHNKTIASSAVASIFTAIIAILSQIAIYTPLGVPLTLQIFGVALAGFVLGAKWGLWSVATYILTGFVGLPVFSGFKGGVHTLLGPTGGFIWGFLLLAFFCGLSNKTTLTKTKQLFSILGILICHICGIIQYSFITKNSLWHAFLTASFPFITKDIILIILSFFVSKKIKVRLN